jgi:hypothetical protein
MLSLLSSICRARMLHGLNNRAAAITARAPTASQRCSVGDAVEHLVTATYRIDPL